MSARRGLSALARERLERFARVLALSGLIGAAYGIRSGSSAASPAVNALIGAVDAVLIAGCVAGIEMFALRSAPLRAISRLPFGAVLALKSAVYAAIAVAVIAAQPAERLAGAALYGATDLARTVGFSLIVTTLFIVLYQAAGLVGYRTFRELVLGKYRAPRAERRFFLFVDVVGSSALAERLGPLRAHQFLARVFTLAAEPVAARRGEIYQYVGDEIVVTWAERDGAPDARPLRCYFEVRAALDAQASQFRERFGVEPQLRAALHLGEVIVGEVGVERRAIVFHGDVMNATARLEQATRDLGCRFIASAEALRALGLPPDLALRDLGALALRGREEPLQAFCVEERALRT
ncbi:MAG TPA: adenylate/guanylate cyclase domain-containing protein [Burkholderiales bacterium]|nr:adenylate/guanylate cyclase domain-containing protein [Burkholderiales bacterium]